MSKLLIEKGRVISPADNLDKQADIYVENGIIKEIYSDLSRLKNDGVRVINAEGKIVCPGFVDIHCHLREPGFEYKEDIETGTRAAAKGGFTAVACMPNTKPVTDSEEVIDYILKRSEQVGAVHVLPIGAITSGSEGMDITDIDKMKKAGAVAVSDDGRPVINANIMKKAMELAGSLNMPVISHCEDMDLAEGGSMNDGETAKAMGVQGISRASEEVMVAREIVLSDTTGAPVHIAHVSTRGSVQLVRDAKRRGLKVTCETCPHYFSLTEKECIGYNTSAKMNPPLRTEDDRIAIIEGLMDGTIDAIATDHAPHSKEEKKRDFEKAPNGIIGLETALALSITYLYRTGKMSLNQIIGCLTVKAAEILNLDMGRLAIGGVADITVFDPDAEWMVCEEEIASKSKNTPYMGKTLTGKVTETVVAGEIKVSEGKLVV